MGILDVSPESSGIHVDMMRDLLECVADILERESITYWLDRGTLLGAFRGGQFLPFDSDVDIHFLFNDWEAILDALQAGLPARFTVSAHHHGRMIRPPDHTHPHRWFRNEHGDFDIADDYRMVDGKHFHTATALVVYRSGTFWADKPNLDLYCSRINRHHDCMDPSCEEPWHEDGRRYLCMPSRRPQDRLVPESLVMPLGEIELAGRRYPAPARVESYLRHLFGYIGENAVHDRASGYWRPAETDAGNTGA
jgi:hypothetical protein